jgi:hypothetical protein
MLELRRQSEAQFARGKTRITDKCPGGTQRRQFLAAVLETEGRRPDLAAGGEMSSIPLVATYEYSNSSSRNILNPGDYELVANRIRIF